MDNQILAIISVIIGFIGLIPFWITLIENVKATKKLGYKVIGEWYSAEYNLKDEPPTNAILTLKIQRRFWSSNSFKIKTVGEYDHPLNQTTWNGEGKVIATNTLSFNWKGEFNRTMRYGTCFVQFQSEGEIGIGYWIGYSSITPLLPVYGYWILRKKESKEGRVELAELNEFAKSALENFKFCDVRKLIEAIKYSREDK